MGRNARKARRERYAMVKYIRPKWSSYVIKIERCGQIAFRTPDNFFAHAKRAMWLNAGDMYVLYKGTWYEVHDGKYGMCADLEYAEVTKDELREMARKAIEKRLWSPFKDSYTWEEVTQIRCYIDSTGGDYYDGNAIETTICRLA